MPDPSLTRRALFMAALTIGSAALPTALQARSAQETRESWDRWRYDHPRDRSTSSPSAFKEPRQRASRSR